MRSQGVDDGTWFDVDAATRYDAPDDSGDALYKTEKGNYVLGTLDVNGNSNYERKTKEIAYQWLLENNHVDELPEEERDTRKI